MSSHEACGIEQRVLDEIIRIITAHKKPQRIVLFGSRATGSFEEASDIDLAIFGEDWSSTDLNLVKARLEENISTPLKFDVLHFDVLTKENLKQEILNGGVVIYESEKS